MGCNHALLVHAKAELGLDATDVGQKRWLGDIFGQPRPAFRGCRLRAISGGVIKLKADGRRD